MMLALCWAFEGKQMQKLDMDSLGVFTVRHFYNHRDGNKGQENCAIKSVLELQWSQTHLEAVSCKWNFFGEKSILTITLHFPHIYTFMFLIFESLIHSFIHSLFWAWKYIRLCFCSWIAFLQLHSIPSNSSLSCNICIDQMSLTFKQKKFKLSWLKLTERFTG